MSLGARIRLARKAKGMSQGALAEEIGVTTQAVSQWERDETNPTSENLFALGEAIGLKGYLNDKTGNLLPYEIGVTRKVPLINKVAAGNWTEVIAHDLLPPETIFYEIHWQPRGDVFALEIDGESMLPEYSPGDVIIIDTGLKPLPGDDVVAILDSGNEATFKRYRPRGDDDNGSPIIELYPLNTDYPTLTMSARNPGRIIGTKEEHRKFRKRR